MSATPCPKCGAPNPLFYQVGDSRELVELCCCYCNHSSGSVTNHAAAVARFYTIEPTGSGNQPIPSQESET